METFSSLPLQQHDGRLPKSSTCPSGVIRSIWNVTLHHPTRPSHFGLTSNCWGHFLYRGSRATTCLYAVSYLFNGNGASTSQVSFKICTPSVRVTSSPALSRQAWAHQSTLRVAACFITKTLEAFRKEDSLC